MSDTSVAVRNPYWDAVQTIPGDDITRRFDGRFSPEGFGMRWVKERPVYDDNVPKRKELVVRYAWSITDPESVAFVAEHSQGRIVDPLAGTGYWCWLLAQYDIDCAASDLHPPNEAGNHWHSTETPGQTWVDVAAADALAVVPHAVGRTLLLSWPPYDSSLGEQIVATFAGSRIIYIGEGRYGCCGTDDMFDELAQGWRLVAHHRPIQWSGLHDTIHVYDRRPVRLSVDEAEEAHDDEFDALN